MTTSDFPPVTDQPDGPGRRLGQKGEVTVIADVIPGAADKLRARVAELQADAFVYEPRVGTVDNFRITLIDNDTRVIASVVYDGDFKPYVGDIIQYAGPWLNSIFDGLAVDYPGTANAEAAFTWVLERSYTANIFFHAHPDATSRDVAKMKRLSAAVGEFLDAAS